MFLCKDLASNHDYSFAVYLIMSLCFPPPGWLGTIFFQTVEFVACVWKGMPVFGEDWCCWKTDTSIDILYIFAVEFSFLVYALFFFLCVTVQYCN